MQIFLYSRCIRSPEKFCLTRILQPGYYGEGSVDIWALFVVELSPKSSHGSAVTYCQFLSKYIHERCAPSETCYFHLFSNMSSPMVKRIKLFLTAYVHFAPFKSQHCFKVCFTHWRADLIPSVGAVNVLLGHHLTYVDSLLVELAMIYLGMLVWTRQGLHRRLRREPQRRYKRFLPSIMVGVPAA